MKRFSLVINDKPYVWDKITIYHKEVLQLATIKQTTEKIIKYEKGPKRNREGELLPDKLVYVQEDMIFSVSTVIPLWSD